MPDVAASTVAQFAADVRRDLALTPKQLQSKYFYDALGSSLFEAICELPWYGITRAECRLLQQHAGAIVSGLDGGTIIELGCGNGEKLITLAEALQARGASARVHLIDVSPEALEATERRLHRLQHFSVLGYQATYEEGLRSAAFSRDGGAPLLVLLLGSNIGNFDAPVARLFLHRIRSVLAAGDLLLLGADLAKPEPQLLLAYDDPLGVTAAFNKNLLVRVNRELGGNFDIQAFAHRAVWNAAERRVEMHLVSAARQRVWIDACGLEVEFAAGEQIWTESSHKYDVDEIRAMGAAAGFEVREQWVDQDARFALTLFGV